MQYNKVTNISPPPTRQKGLPLRHQSWADLIIASCRVSVLQKCEWSSDVALTKGCSGAPTARPDTLAAEAQNNRGPLTWTDLPAAQKNVDHSLSNYALASSFRDKYKVQPPHKPDKPADFPDFIYFCEKERLGRTEMEMNKVTAGPYLLECSECSHSGQISIVLQVLVLLGRWYADGLPVHWVKPGCCDTDHKGNAL